MTETRDSDNWFAYSATLRIFGDIPNLDEISQHLGVVPAHAHRKKESRAPDSTVYKHDMWSYNALVDKSEPLHVHINALWNIFKDHKEYILKLKRNLTVDVFLGYRSNCDHCGVEVPYESLEIFRELQVPFGLSIIIVKSSHRVNIGGTPKSRKTGLSPTGKLVPRIPRHRLLDDSLEKPCIVD